MKNYIELWYRGWWAALMMLCLSIVPVIVTIPMSRMLPKHIVWYWATFLFGSLLVIIPVYGWIFEMFAKKTPRIDV